MILRQRAIRKLKHLVGKCCKKWIKFSQKYFNISKQLASNPSSVTDTELMELWTECLESLEACNVSFSSSSTSESCPEEPLKIKKKKLKRKSLVQSPPMYDPTNPYNVAYEMNPMYSRGTRHEARKHLSRYAHATPMAVHMDITHTAVQIFTICTQRVFTLSMNIGRKAVLNNLRDKLQVLTLTLKEARWTLKLFLHHKDTCRQHLSGV